MCVNYVDIEDNVIAKVRRALFGEDFNLYYELLKNRLIFLDGGKDDLYFLEHYVLLGNDGDPDRFEAMDEIFQTSVQKLGNIRERNIFFNCPKALV